MSNPYYEMVELIRAQGSKNSAQSAVVCGEVSVVSEPYSVGYTIFGEATTLPVKTSEGIELTECEGEYTGVFLLNGAEYILMSLVQK